MYTHKSIEWSTHIHQYTKSCAVGDTHCKQSYSVQQVSALEYLIKYLLVA